MTFIKKYTGKLRKNLCGIFLILILGWMLIEPLTNRWPFFNVAFAYFFSFLILGGFYVITAHKKIFIICLFLTVLSLLMEALGVFHDSKICQLWAYLLGAGVDVLITISIIWHTAFKLMYTRDDVFAGVIGFLLIGGCFADMYFILQQLQPGAVHFQKTLVSVGSSVGASWTAQQFLFQMDDFLYFSYMTITTVGYGDVVPISHFARRLTSIEACLGVLYIAVFVGRLMGLYLRGNKNESLN